MRVFIIDEKTKIVGTTHNTRTGFRHLVKFIVDGKEIESRSVSYYNRTWESYDYQTAIRELLRKMVTSKRLTAERAEHIQAICDGRAKAEFDSRFKTLGAIAMMGEIMGETKKEKNDWKTRMFEAGLSGYGLEKPNDWDSLSEDEKEKRLNKVIEMMRN